MTYADKVKAWNAYIKTKGINKAYGRFPSLLGIRLESEPAPLLFHSSLKIAFYLGANFGLPWGLAMYFLSWRHSKDPVYLFIIGTLLASVGYGFFMVYLVRREKAKLDVVSWESFNPVNIVA